MSAFLSVEPLGFRHPLGNRETAAGFASRLAAVNGVDLTTLSRDMAVSHLGLDHGDVDAVRLVAALGGLGRRDTEALLKYSPRRLPDARASVVCGHALAGGSVMRTIFRFCPLCVAEDIDNFEGPHRARPWLRLEWTLREVRSCVCHDVALVDTKPQRRAFQAFDFAETVAAQVLPELGDLVRDAVPLPHSKFEEWVVARLDGIVGSDSWLDEFGLRAGMAFCEALGVSSLHPAKVKTGDFEEAAWAAAAAEGFAVASAGPSGVNALLDRLVAAQADTRGVLGLRDTYGYLYAALQRTLKDPDFSAFREVVREHAFATLPLEAGTEVLGEALEERRVHTVRSASLASGAHARTIRRMFSRKGVDDAARGSGRRDHRVTVDAAVVSAALLGLRDAMTFPEVMEATGIPRLHLQSLISQGFLPTLTESRNVENAKHRIGRADVDALMKRLFAGAQRVDGATGRQVPVMEARHVACATLDDAIAFILNGRAKWKGRVGSGERYGDLLVDADELVALVRKEAPMVGLMRHTIDDVIPGLGKDSVDLLAELGCLEMAREFSPAARREVEVVTRESAERFACEFVTLGELCRSTGLHHKKVRQALRSRGVDQAFPYEWTGAFIYARNAAVGAMERARKGAR